MYISHSHTTPPVCVAPRRGEREKDLFPGRRANHLTPGSPHPPSYPPPPRVVDPIRLFRRPGTGRGEEEAYDTIWKYGKNPRSTWKMGGGRIGTKNRFCSWSADTSADRGWCTVENEPIRRPSLKFTKKTGRESAMGVVGQSTVLRPFYNWVSFKYSPTKLQIRVGSLVFLL